MNTIKKITLALVCILLSHLVTAQTYKPVLKVSKGQEYKYEMNMTMDMTQSMGGQEMKVGSTMSATLKNAIENVLPDGKIEIVASQWDGKVTTKMMKDTTMTYPGQIGSSTKITVDKLGNVVSKIKIEGTGTKDPSLSSFDNLVNNVLFCEYPETPIKEGDKWTKEHSDSITAGPMGKIELKIKSEYKLGAKETVEGKSLLKVTCSSTLQISGKGNIQGMDVALDGTGAKTDDIYIDPATGVVFSDTSKTEMEMSIAVTGQQNMTIPMTQKMVTSFKLIK